MSLAPYDSTSCIGGLGRARTDRTGWCGPDAPRRQYKNLQEAPDCTPEANLNGVVVTTDGGTPTVKPSSNSASVRARWISLTPLLLGRASLWRSFDIDIHPTFLPSNLEVVS